MFCVQLHHALPFDVQRLCCVWLVASRAQMVAINILLVIINAGQQPGATMQGVVVCSQILTKC